jgi:hypothetical protein
MARVYSVPIDAIAVAAAQDVFFLLASASVPLEIHSVQLDQKTLTGWEAKDITFRRFPATVTAGTGGAVVTPIRHSPGDQAAVTTARRNDTTLATTTGTPEIIKGFDFNFLNGFLWLPAGAEDRIILAPSTAFIVRLGTAPSASMTVSGELTFAELV